MDQACYQKDEAFLGSGWGPKGGLFYILNN